MDLMYRHGMTPTQRLIWLKKALGGEVVPSVEKTVSGSIIHVMDALAKFVKNLTVSIEPMQSGSGDPAPDNIRPIAGWTGVTLHHGADTTNPTVKFIKLGVDETGNVFTPNYGSRTGENNGVTFTQYDDNTVYAIGETTINGAVFNYALQTLSAGDYVLVGMPSPDCSIRIGLNTIGGTFVKYLTNGETFTVENEQKYGFRVRVATNSTIDSTFNPILIPKAQYDSATRNIYSGTLDVTTGVLSVDQFYVEVSSETEITYIGAGSGGAKYFRIAAPKPILYGNSAFCKCSHLANTSIASTNTNVGIVTYRTGSSNYTYGFSFRFPNDVVPYGDIDAMKTYADAQIAVGTPIQMLCKIAQPIAYQLTPTQVKMLLGENYIWADTGDSELTYLAEA